MTFLLHNKPNTLRNKLLSFFFTNPMASLHLRDIARKIEVSPGNLSNEMKRLVREGIFEAKTIGRQKFFSLNSEHALYDELKSIVLKTIGMEGVLKKLVRAHDAIRRAFVFGSYASGNMSAESDIDLCLIVTKGRFDASGFAAKIRVLEKRLHREINYQFYTAREWDQLLSKKDSFIVNLKKGPKIELIETRENEETA